MDQKRLLLAIAISVAILLGFQLMLPTPKPVPAPIAGAPAAPTPDTGTPTAPAAAGTAAPAPIAPASAKAVPRDVPRLPIAAPRLEGSISLLGARLDDLVLKGYRETVQPGSPLVRLLEPRSEKQPYYIQVGWSADDGVTAKLPDSDTLWTGSGVAGPGTTALLRWDNGAGLVFEIEVGVDADYMFTLRQRVRNTTGASVALHPWARIRRDYKPHTAGYYILHEGMLGVLDGRLKETTYDHAKSEGEKKGGVALEQTGPGGWIGFTDKYWLTALVPAQASVQTAAFRHISEAGSDRYQVDFVAKDAVAVPPGGMAETVTHAFAGAKEVHVLDRYESAYQVPSFDKAVDFGWFYFITKPFFYALDWLFGITGNFGIAILIFTLFIKGLFFPLANKSYRSMSKMKLLAPKMTALREQYKEEPQKLQQAMMEMYKTEKVNPASGCLPIVIQIPVFFSLYKVIFTTIEMRHAPFFGWIRDLSAVDPTNVFTLFGLLPYDPAMLPMFGHFLHLGAWPLVMGFTMWAQMRLNPPPPDPIQAKIFAWMPVLFTFMLASFPAGLVIYWAWNNTLTIGQQWLIMRQTKLDKPQAARV
ncbi:MAG: membrane protein insertase YidC [Acetobacteraceae bacterium]|nr:membrane protein insertase YidC [Acetobacteraceae bacterium]